MQDILAKDLVYALYKQQRYLNRACKIAIPEKKENLIKRRNNAEISWKKAKQMLFRMQCNEDYSEYPGDTEDIDFNGEEEIYPKNNF